MRERCSPESLKNRLDQMPLSVFIASSRFSNTLSSSNTVGFWNLRPMPVCAICASLRRLRSMVWPKNAVPDVGRVLPVMTSIMVVLPAPFGPMIERNSPRSMASVRLLSALKPSKLTVIPSRYRITPWRVSRSRASTGRSRPTARSKALSVPEILGDFTGVSVLIAVMLVFPCHAGAHAIAPPDRRCHVASTR